MQKCYFQECIYLLFKSWLLCQLQIELNVQCLSTYHSCLSYSHELKDHMLSSNISSLCKTIPSCWILRFRKTVHGVPVMHRCPWFSPCLLHKYYSNISLSPCDHAVIFLPCSLVSQPSNADYLLTKVQHSKPLIHFVCVCDCHCDTVFVSVSSLSLWLCL